MDDYVKLETQLKEKPEGLLWDSPDSTMRSKVWVKTWGQIIREWRVRLKIFQQALDLTADKDVGPEYLKKTYARILLGAETAEVVPEPDQETESDKQMEVKEEAKG